MPYAGYVRVAALVPRVHVANPAANVSGIRDLLRTAEERGVQVAVFPELCLTGYTCGDLFHQPTLLDAAWDALESLLVENPYSGLAVVGLPFAHDGQVFNVAAIVQGEHVLGLVPKSYLPNYQEFYEARWFAPGTRATTEFVTVRDRDVPFGTDILFDASGQSPHLVIGVEICEDLWTPLPPSSWQALAGATLLVNLSASNEVIGKAEYRRGLVVNQSGRCLAGYVYAASGVHESTTDLVFGGHCLIAENGSVLAESERFQREPSLLVQDIDIARLQQERWKINSFGESKPVGLDREWIRVPFTIAGEVSDDLVRDVDAHPFVPHGKDRLQHRCEEIFHTQVAGLARRLEHLGQLPITLGVSGGLDSTLALLVACKTLDRLKMPRRTLKALTMPGFGTTTRTLANARRLMSLLDVTAHEIDIRSICLEQMRAMNHRPLGIEIGDKTVEQLTDALRRLPADGRGDLVFENIQARTRMNLLMNTGFVIGTGDLSELALGWCTYAGDHMSMYNPNSSIPKTLVRFLVDWAAEHEFTGDARSTLKDIVATRISPELLPTSATGEIVQETESVVGPYELHDFFLFQFLRYAAPPEKILFLARHATFSREYSDDEIQKWLMVFLKRFFANQFKRSCLPDGPKVGTINLSPRGDWRMPSDAAAKAWLERIEEPTE
jgi:NAD+ synthase (glutamine-hydrolysing)